MEALTASPDADTALHRYDSTRRLRGTRMVLMARLMNRASTGGRFTLARNLALPFA